MNPISVYLLAKMPPKSRYLSSRDSKTRHGNCPTKVTIHGKQTSGIAIGDKIYGAPQHSPISLP
jgi:hypothetical protein